MYIRGLFGCPTPLTLNVAICTGVLARAGAIAWVDANWRGMPKLSFRDCLGGCMMRVANPHVNLTVYINCIGSYK